MQLYRSDTRLRLNALMLDGLELGKFIESDDTEEVHLKLNKNIKTTWLPYIFQINLDNDMTNVVEEWLKTRIVPKNRIGIADILKRLSLKKYSKRDIFELTHGSAITDPFWIAINSDDTYTKCSKRGKLGEKYPYNSLNLQPEESYIWRI